MTTPAVPEVGATETAPATVAASRSVMVGAALAYVAFFAAIGGLFPYLPVYYASLGLDLATIGLLAALSAAAALAGAPLWGLVTDRFRLDRWALPIAASVAASGSVALYLSGASLALPLAVVWMFAGTSGVVTLLDVRTLQLLGHDRFRYGRVRMWGSASFLVSTIVTGAIVDRAGARGLFAVVVTMLLVTVVVSAHLPSVVRGAQPWARRHVVALLSDRVFLLVLAGGLIEWAATEAVNSFVSIRIVDLGGSGSAVGAAWALSAAVQVPVMFLYSRVAARSGIRPLLLVGAAVLAVRSFAYVLVHDPAAFVLLTTLEGIGYALFLCCGVAFVSGRAPAHLLATGQGVFLGLTFSLGRVIGASAGGLVAQRFGIEGLFVAAGLVGLVALGVLSRVPLAGPAHPRTESSTAASPPG